MENKYLRIKCYIILFLHTSYVLISDVNFLGHRGSRCVPWYVLPRFLRSCDRAS